MQAEHIARQAATAGGRKRITGKTLLVRSTLYRPTKSRGKVFPYS